MSDVSPFLQALFVQPSLVMGKQLQPFSAFHAACLMLVNSPFLSGGELTHCDVSTAVYLCSLTWEDRGDVLSPNLTSIAEWGNKHVETDMLDITKQIESHLSDCMRFPELWVKETGANSDSGVPFPFRLVATVLSNCSGITEAEAWDMPLSRLAGYRACIAEDNGAEILTDRQRELIKQAQQAQEGEGVSNG